MMTVLYDIRDYGGTGDGKTLCTEAVQKAVDVCHGAGGGVVLVPPGEYLIGTVRLKSNVELRLAPGAVLSASLNLDDYPDADYGFFDPRKCPRGSARCLIFAGQCENVSITGQGKIDCKGRFFLREETENGKTRFVRTSDRLPGRMLFFMSCRNVVLSDFLLSDMAGGWGAWINDCDNVSVSRVRMECDERYPNADGVHINCSSDVTVSDCILRTGDDSVVVRAACNTLKEKRPCRRVTVSGCMLSSGCQGVRIGWRNDYEIKDCLFSDLVIESRHTGIAAELPHH
ncbi:MAG: glycosyl hydrolase family 28 protein, partial [Clostridia bacterium]|nr:glycosyl hydrolase family 28 protein [Clostridia bacterium]